MLVGILVNENSMKISVKGARSSNLSSLDPPLRFDQVDRRIVGIDKSRLNCWLYRSVEHSLLLQSDIDIGGSRAAPGKRTFIHCPVFHFRAVLDKNLE